MFSKSTHPQKYFMSKNISTNISNITMYKYLHSFGLNSCLYTGHRSFSRAKGRNVGDTSSLLHSFWPHNLFYKRGCGPGRRGLLRHILMDKISIPRNVLDKIRFKQNKTKAKTKVPPGVTITQSTVGYFYIHLETNARFSQ